jgi:4-amino-4-deoxychorismate lyase
MGPEALDRGLAYGDGLFETMRAHRGTLPWWPRHRARLTAGATRLGITMPEDARLDAALGDAVAEAQQRFGGEATIKLILTRGVGARGYAPPPAIKPSLIFTTSEAPAVGDDPLRVDVLDLRLAVQPALAGMKHLNRLEQVLGAREAAERGLDDGLMADADGFLTCSTRANLFAHLDGRWITPPLDRAGVAGVARGVLLDAWSPPGGLHVMPLPMAVLPRVDALLLSNVVRGILPVGRCGARALDPRPVGFAEARAALAASHPAFRES